MAVTQLTHELLMLSLSLVAGTPLLLALSLLLGKRLAPLFAWAPLPALLTAWLVPLDLVVSVPWFFMGGRMGLDQTGRALLAFTGLIWLLAGLSARAQGLLSPLRPRFAAFFLTAQAGNLGLILAQELLGFYLFFALMSFAGYGLVVYEQSDAARRAGRRYLLLVMLGEIALFLGLLIQYGPHPEDRQALLLLLLIAGFGVKIGTPPFHGWMPLAYGVMPRPAAAALAGAMVNAGLLGWLRFLPPGDSTVASQLPAAPVILATLGCLAALWGVLLGLRQQEPGAILAGSSISQLGLMTLVYALALGGLGGPSGPGGQESHQGALPLLLFFMAHHGLAKATLFLGLEQRIRGPLGLALFALPALALAGLPTSGGQVAKGALKELTHQLPMPWANLSSAFLLCSSLLTTLLMLHLLARFRAQQPGPTAPGLPWLLGLTATLLLPWLLPYGQGQLPTLLQPTALFNSLWPLLAGLACFLILRRFLGGHLSPSQEPDRYHPWSRTLAWLVGWLTQGQALQQGWNSSLRHSWLQLTNWSRRQCPARERVLGRWLSIGTAYLSLCLLLLLLLFFPD